MFSVGTSGYAIASVVLLACLTPLLSSWRGQLDRFLLLLAVASTALWTGVIAFQATRGIHASATLRLFDLLHYLAWLALLFQHLMTDTRSPRRLLGRLWLFSITVSAGLLAVFTAAVADLVALEVPASTAILDILYPAGPLLLALAALALIQEVLARFPDKRGEVLLFGIAVGGLFGYDVAYHTLSSLNGPHNALWDARGYVIAAAAALLFAATRSPTWSRDIYISHSAAFHFSVFAAAAVLLLLLAVGPQFIPAAGSVSGNVAQVVILFGALTGIVVAVASERKRAQMRVFLNKHFFNYKYDYREEWLRFIRTLSKGGPGAHLLETVIQALAQIVGSKGGVLWLRSESGHYDPVAHLNVPVCHVNRERPNSSLAKFLDNWQWIINVDEYAQEPELYQELELPDWLREEDAWLVVPLMQDVELLGFVVIARPLATRKINWEDHDLLKTAGRQAATHLAQLMAVQALVEAREFQAFSRLSAFVIHDLKNLIAQLSLVVSNAAKHKHNPAFLEDAINTVQNSVEKMNRLMAQLRKGHTKTGRTADVELAELARTVIKDRHDCDPKPTLDRVQSGLRVLANRDRLSAVLEHLVQNAQEATSSDGWVKVCIASEGNHAVIEIADNGCGMDGKFIRDRLFRPFDTTKGQGGMGIGAYESREYVRELGGDVLVESSPGKGTVFRIKIPLATVSDTPTDTVD